MGDGTASHSITGLGFSPEYAVVMSAGAARAIHACSAAPAGKARFRQAAKYLIGSPLSELTASVEPRPGAPYVNQSGVWRPLRRVEQVPRQGQRQLPAREPHRTTSRSLASTSSPSTSSSSRSTTTTPVSATPPRPPASASSRWPRTTTPTSPAASQQPSAGLQESTASRSGARLTINRAFATATPTARLHVLLRGLQQRRLLRLATTQAGEVVTVDAPDAKMVWRKTGQGGQLDEFYVDQPNPAVNRAGTISPKPHLHADRDRSESSSRPGSSLDVLEATSTRVRLHQRVGYRPTARLKQDWTSRATRAWPSARPRRRRHPDVPWRAGLHPRGPPPVPPPGLLLL